MGKTVLVTGVSRYLGGQCATRLAEHPEVDRVIGVDVIPPPHDLGRVEFIRADIRNPVIAKVIDRTGADTVVHMNVIATPAKVGGRASMKEINVIGSMQLLAACGKSSSVKRLVVKSTAGVYGASPRDPAMFTEDQSAKVLPRAGWAKDSVEVEGYVRSFSRRRPDVSVVLLRFANFIGPGLTSAMTEYLSLPSYPIVLGYDPRWQFIHESDGMKAMELATLGTTEGAVNVAGDGVLTLSQAAGLAGRPIMPVPASVVPGAIRVLNRRLASDFSDDMIRHLMYGRVLDTSRMRSDLGLDPTHTTRDAFTAFVDDRLRHRMRPADMADQAEQLVSTAASRVRRWSGAPA